MQFKLTKSIYILLSALIVSSYAQAPPSRQEQQQQQQQQAGDGRPNLSRGINQINNGINELTNGIKYEVTHGYREIKTGIKTSVKDSIKLVKDETVQNVDKVKSSSKKFTEYLTYLKDRAQVKLAKFLLEDDPKKLGMLLEEEGKGVPRREVGTQKPSLQTGSNSNSGEVFEDARSLASSSSEVRYPYNRATMRDYLRGLEEEVNTESDYTGNPVLRRGGNRRRTRMRV